MKNKHSLVRLKYYCGLNCQTNLKGQSYTALPKKMSYGRTVKFFGCQMKLHLDDIPVNRHFPQVCPIPLCGELAHLLVDEPFLLLRHPELHLDVPFPICHSASPPFLIRVWDYPSKQFSCLGAGVPLNRKSASGYSLAVLATTTFPSFSPLTNTTIPNKQNGQEKLRPSV